ncbi:alpha-methylacyl-CoA racemase [Verticillium alfalfae VaMs.102]|uniref:Alpha-methylacyl-CoA racemase n=1 Tax=Verticillium alfalfae (strain VaMs.102 / ATCC MYA-4576 / FGSC 10136) TaxID=526221 RepID=C9SG14_VERA1|nr:alpha-methylacyl-CoA racemase [Verticillium alfalfae VaMs.102]EEY17418.1 alpha-methylacyl-CoA racemase [Verticillium alfalfae VaMs.102]
MAALLRVNTRLPWAARRLQTLSPSRHRSTPASDLPLAGITVVSLEQALAAPLCTRHLADQGARVIKVERPGVGDFARAYDTRVKGQSSHFIWANRGKESLALDLKVARDLDVLKTLVRRADVLVQNLAPGASARLGLSFDALRGENPGLIVCDISGYGADGPYRGKKAYDLLVQSEAGVLSVTGTQDERVKVGISLADIAAGIYAHANILTALIKRGKTGLGSRIDISMLESMVEWMGFPMYYTYDGALPRLRVANRDELRDIICRAFAQLTTEEVLAKLDEAAIANAKINELHDVWEHPQLKARNRWTEIDTDAGRVPALIPPGCGPERASFGKVPGLGEHNSKIFAELGL